MPEKYIWEMVSDWLGASKGYTGSWDMTKWLHDNLPSINQNLHKETWLKLQQVLARVEYFYIAIEGKNNFWILANGLRNRILWGVLLTLD